MEEKPSASIKPYLDKLTLGITRILGEWRRARAAWARGRAGGSGGGGVSLGCHGNRRGREGAASLSAQGGGPAADPQASAPAAVSRAGPGQAGPGGGFPLAAPPPTSGEQPQGVRCGRPQGRSQVPPLEGRGCAASARTQDTKPLFLGFGSTAEILNLST